MVCPKADLKVLILHILDIYVTINILVHSRSLQKCQNALTFLPKDFESTKSSRN